MDALQALLGAQPAIDITSQVPVKRLNTKFTIKALTGEDINAIRTQATRPTPNGKKMELKVNEEEVARLLVVNATIDPNFNDASLLKHFGAIDGGECVQKALLAGEIALLQNAIFELSGFGDEEEEVEEAKN